MKFTLLVLTSMVGILGILYFASYFKSANPVSAGRSSLIDQTPVQPAEGIKINDLPPYLPGINSPLDDQTDSKISAKYEELKKELRVLERRLPAGKLSDFRKSQLRLARIFVLNNQFYQTELHKLFDEVLSFRTSYPRMRGVDAKAVLSQFENPSPQAYTFAALLADDPSLFKEALAKFPNDAEVLLASLIHRESFLQDSIGIKKLETLQPDSPWPGILHTIAAMKRGNISSASLYLNRALAQEIGPFGKTYDEAWLQMSDSFKTENKSSLSWPSSAESLFGKSSDGFLGDIILGAPKFYKQHQDDPKAVAFVAGALALSERASETQSLVGERVALMNQLDILAAMGPEVAQPYLSMPYREYVDSLHARRATLHDLITTVDNFKQSLSSDEKARFESLASANGDLAAYEAMLQK